MARQLQAKRKCIVPGCDPGGLARSFHSLPRSLEHREAWLQACKVVASEIQVKEPKVCSEHFKPDDFESDLKSRLMGTKRKAALCPGAIPSVFAWNQPDPDGCSPAKYPKLDLSAILAMDEAAPVCLPNEARENDVNAIKDAIGTMESLENTKSTQVSFYDGENTRLYKIIERQKRTIACQAKIIRSLRRMNLTLRSTGHETAIVTKSLAKTFTKPQIRKILSPGLKRVAAWTTDDIIRGITIRYASGKAYRQTRSQGQLPLPCESAIRKWTKDFKYNTGIQHHGFAAVKEKVRLEPLSKLGVLAYDEMDIRNVVDYDKSTDQIRGPFKKALVVILRSLTHSWRQIVFCDFNRIIDLKLFNEIVVEAENSGVHVVATSFDLGNHRFQKEIKFVSKKMTPNDELSIQHPLDKSRKIFAFPDCPHLMKLVRNHWLDQGFTLEGTEQKILSKMYHKLNYIAVSSRWQTTHQV